MLKNYLLVAGGFVSTIIVLKIFFRKPPPPNVTYEMSSNLEEDDSENMSMSTIDENLPKLWAMKKEELIDECLRRNIACLGTVRILRERLRIAREEDA